MKTRRFGVLLLLVLGVAAGNAACDSTPPTAVAPSPTVGAAAYCIAVLPQGAEVLLLGEAAYWRTLPSASSTQVRRQGVFRLDLATGRSTRDAWLSRLFAQRRISAWVVRGSRAVWVDASVNKPGNGGSTLVGSRVYAAERGSPGAQALTPLEWGVTSDTGVYGPAVGGLVFDGSLVAWHDARSSLVGGRGPACGRDAGVFACRVPGQIVRRVASSNGTEPLAVAGTTVFVARGVAAGGHDSVEWCDAVSGRRSSVPATGQVEGLAATSQAVVWKAQPDVADSPVWEVGTCDLATQKVRRLSAVAIGEATPAIAGDIVAWAEALPGAVQGPGYVIKGFDRQELRTFDICSVPEGGPPDVMAMAGGRLLWAVHDERTSVYGVRLERQGEQVVSRRIPAEL